MGKVFRVPQGTMPAPMMGAQPRVLKMGRFSEVSIDTHVPSYGKEGRRILGGDRPKMLNPIRAYERIEVFGLQCHPKTITGNTKGDPIWNGIMPNKK